MGVLATVHLEKGKLVLHDGGTWEGVGDVSDELERVGDYTKYQYEYSPADGYPGAALARQVADMLGGRAEVPPHPQGKPGTLY